MKKVYLRIASNPVGMARLVTNYSRIKELEKSIPIEEIARIFDLDKEKLDNFVGMADSFVSGDTSLNLNLVSHNKEAFTSIANALENKNEL